ncbi:MAG: hypothetical protein HC772_15625 [Leptolyngbyaceae cyanobacterium CRU_2_3]|nr:hypothetical protein [Leptolyngbyaceae cyanobacterium CRU_2_3]
MKDVAQGGRTVLFVSHNMAAIRQLCDSAIMLQRGELVFSGSAEAGVKHYLNSATTNQDAIGTVSSYGIALTDAALEDLDRCPTRSPIFDREHSLRLQLHAHSPLSDCAVVVRIYDDIGTLVSSLCTVEEGITPFALKDEVEIRFDLGRISLFPGSYRMSIFLYRSNDPIPTSRLKMYCNLRSSRRLFKTQCGPIAVTMALLVWPRVVSCSAINLL